MAGEASPQAGAENTVNDRLAKVAAIVPAKDRADTVGDTVQALRRVGRLDRIIVVDDGSTDATVDRARAAGAEVLRLPANRGKGAAVAAGVAECPDVDVFLLIDADVVPAAGAADALLDPVLADEADLVVGVLPSASAEGGFGTVKRLAAGGVRRACGRTFTAPLSGQRAVRARYLRNLRSAERFGLEVAMTIDAVRAGARLREVDVPMDHHQMGRSVRRFVHRGHQGADIGRALWSRLTSEKARVRGMVLATMAVLAALIWAGTGQVSASVEGDGGADKVVLVGVPRLALDDLDFDDTDSSPGSPRLPTFERLIDEGAVAATNVRTSSKRPSTAEAYATLGAGTRASVEPGMDLALPADAHRSGPAVAGDIVVPQMPAVVDAAGPHRSSTPGSLGTTLAEHGLETAVVTNSDVVRPGGEMVPHRPAALAMADESGSIGSGTVSADQLLMDDPAAPYGVRADVDRYLEETLNALDEASMVTVDLGETKRAAAYARASSPEAGELVRQRALERVDEYLARLLPELDPNTLLLVVGVRPPTSEWELTPTIAYGSGVVPGTLHSPTTRREGLITIHDLAPTVLAWLDAEPAPAGMEGSSLRFRSGPSDMGGLRQLNDHAGSRERVYFPMALTFIGVQVLVYLIAAVTLPGRVSSAGTLGRAGAGLRLLVLTFAAWPLATFVERAIPGIENTGMGRQVIVWLLAGSFALLASRARRRVLAPLAWIAGATVAFLIVDVAMGANLQVASILGYSPHTSSRFVGFGNTAFAVLAACAVVLVAIHVEYAPRRSEALVTAGGFLTVVLFADTWTMLGADVGGILTMVPVFGATMLALSGRRLSWRHVVLFGSATLVVLVLFAAVDLLRPDGATGHLGRFVAGAASGDGNFLTTIERKWATNMAVFGQSMWTWTVPLVVAFMLYVLLIARGWQRLLPYGSALRTGVVATVAAGLIGWLVNDSGVVVSALVFVFIGPYLTLLALDHAQGQPELLPPYGPTSSA